MTSLTFYGGVNEIGGNKILLEDKDTKVFLDFGKGFGRKTATLLSKLKVTVIEASSKLKHEIKTNKGIQTGLVIMLFAMGLPEIQEFINVYQLDSFPFALTSTALLGAFGVLMIGNGR